jgi:hypothetical protein
MIEGEIAKWGACRDARVYSKDTRAGLKGCVAVSDELHTGCG